MRCPSIPALATFVVFAFNLPNTKAQTINAYDDLNEALNLINQARGAQGIQPLAWNTDLVTYAHVWASQMATGQVGFEHASGAYRPEQGENLYEETASSCDATSSTPLVKAVQDWLAQAALYDGQPITTGHEHWLHWSQCMWNDTTMIGCASAYSITETCNIYDVCRFYPQGNIVGETPF